MRTQINRSSLSKWIGLAGVLCSIASSGYAQVSVQIGTLLPGQSVTITYEAAIESALPSSVTSISSQGIVSGGNFASVNTDDPESTSLDDATLTPIGNHAPDANPDTLFRSPNEDVKVQLTSLLSNDTDAENDPVTIIGVVSPTTAGAAVTLSGAWIYYAHAGTAADWFTYVVSDGRGGTRPGTVLVHIKDPDAQSRSTLRISVDPAGAHIESDGIPGRVYTIEFKDDVSLPWQTLDTATSDATGLYHCTDPAGTALRIYRSVHY